MSCTPGRTPVSKDSGDVTKCKTGGKHEGVRGPHLRFQRYDLALTPRTRVSVPDSVPQGDVGAGNAAAPLAHHARRGHRLQRPRQQGQAAAAAAGQVGTGQQQGRQPAAAQHLTAVHSSRVLDEVLAASK